MEEAKNTYREVLKENEALKDMCERLKKENNDLQASYDGICMKLQVVSENADNRYEEQCEKIDKLGRENNELQKKYDELEEKYNNLEVANNLKKARLQTFEYCIEHIFGK